MTQPKWQPVVVVLADARRLECECGTLAVFVVLDEVIGDDGKKDFDYTAWCQECFAKAQEEV